jgi:nucleotide-binding universal stress UspA family protein
VVRGSAKDSCQRVMIGVDVGTPATGPEALAFAFEEAARRDADVYAFYAWEDPAVLYAYGSQIFMHEQREAALKRYREALADVLAPWQERYPDVRVTSEALAGVPAPLLVEATGLADLVVIGGRARDGGDGMRVGAIAHTVLHHAHCPVAVVPEH